jgi:hypothetical protein
LSHREHKKEQSEVQNGGNPLGVPSAAQSSLCQILQGIFSSAESVHTEKEHLCKPLAERSANPLLLDADEFC